jgi:hypothetical protein
LISSPVQTGAPSFAFFAKGGNRRRLRDGLVKPLALETNDSCFEQRLQGREHLAASIY